MKISVVVPVYNAAPHLAACLDSIVRQTHADWECICVDDGSTDRSAEILESYAARDGRFHVWRQANAGVSAARNAGMACATGAFVTFLDSDDTYDSQALAILADVCSRSDAEVVRYASNTVTDHAHDVPLVGVPTFAEIDLNASSASPLRQCSLGWASAISARLAKKVSWPALTHCEDPLFILRCMKRARKSVFIDGHLANYLIRPGSAARTVALPMIASTCRYLVMAYDECAAMPGFEKSKADTCAFILAFLTGPLSGCGKDVAPADRLAAEAAVRTARNLLAARDPAFEKQACREVYDFAFTLGSACTATDILRQANLQYRAFPFDWIGRLSVEARTDFIVSDFTDYLSLDRLRLESAFDDGCHARYVDSRYGTAFYHDFPVGMPLAESYPAVRAKYDRRKVRLLHHLENAKSVLVVWISDYRDVQDGVMTPDETMITCLNRLERRFPGTHFSMIIFDQAESGAPVRERWVMDGRIRRVALDYRDWAKGPGSWALRADVLLPYLSRYRVCDYHSSGETHANRWTRLFSHLKNVFVRKGVRSS